jgi:type II secretory pathway component GspD/PulD (secretin)
MKTKLHQVMNKTCCTILASLAGMFIATAQTDMPPTAGIETNPPAAVEPASTEAPADMEATPVATEATPVATEATPVATEATPVATEATPAATEATPVETAPITSAPEPVSATPAPAAEAPAPVPAAAATNAAIAAPDTSTETAMPATTNAPEQVAVGIPQIRFSDVPITTAIENLARLANINYMLDPKIGYGQPDANGQIKVEPMLSIRWENITAENALIALLDNYGLQLIHDKKTGIDRITLKDPTAPPPLFTKVVQLKYASVSNMVDAAQSVLTDKRSKVISDSRTSQMIVVATDPEQVAVEALVNQLDKPTRQVLIETRLVEISSNPKTKKGVDWTGTLQNQNVSFGNGNTFGEFITKFPGDGFADPAGVTTTTPWSSGGSVITEVGGGGYSWNTKSGTTPTIGFLNADGLRATLSFLNSSSEAQIMSTPRIVTLDNEQAKIQVTRGYPVFSVQAGTQNSAGGSQVSYTNVGTMLRVTPRISANDYIWLRVVPEVSSFAGNFQGPVTGTGKDATVLTAPLFDVRTLETQVLIPNSNTLVLGGLVNDNPHQDNTKVPFLGDIPYLGLLFRSEEKALIKANLLIFITPTIIKDSDFQTSSSGDFMKSKPQPMKDPMDPTTAWDSPVKKGGWSNPIGESAR